MSSKHFRILLFVLLSLLLTFTACDRAEDNTPAETTGTPEPSELVVYSANQTDFTVVRAEVIRDPDMEAFVGESAAVFRKNLNKRTGVEFAIGTDWLEKNEAVPTEKHEILVGETNRAESAKAMEALTFEGYLIRVSEHKIAIVGSNKTMLTEALFYFQDRMLTNEEYLKDGTLAFPVGLEIKHEQTEAQKDIFGYVGKRGREVEAFADTVFNFKAKNGFNAAQGACTDGKHVWFVMKKRVNNEDKTYTETDIVVKVDMATWTVVKESAELPLDHANDMTFDTKRNQIIVTNMLDNKITLIDPETLEITETKKLAISSYCIGYDIKNNRFALGGGAKINVTNDQFAVQLKTGTLTAVENYTAQGMDVTDQYVLFPMSPNKNEYNLIRVFTWSGSNEGFITLRVKKWESETLFHYGDDWYVQFNHQGSTISKLEFYVKLKEL